jgi:uncharacterized membrane protein
MSLIMPVLYLALVGDALLLYFVFRWSYKEAKKKHVVQ